MRATAIFFLACLQAEEMAARYKQMLLEQAEDGEPMGVAVD